jgi:hypothetical protein
MIVYEEVVQLRRFMSPVREIFILATVPAFAGYLYWSEIRGTNILSHPASSIGLVTFLAFEILPTLMILNAALFPEVCVRINEEALILKRGFFRKGIPLDLIIEVHPVAASRVNRTTVREKLYQSSDFLFLDRRDSQNVEQAISLHLGQKRSPESSSAKPHALSESLHSGSSLPISQNLFRQHRALIRPADKTCRAR